jgi:hypothetical protein
MRRKNTKSNCGQILTVLEYLYFETNQKNPTTYEEIEMALEEKGVYISTVSLRKYINSFIDEMGYPIRKVEPDVIGQPLLMYWEV